MDNIEAEYEEIITTIGELQENDLVMGTDNKWHKIKLMPIHIPERMFKFITTLGSVYCSGEHQWTLFGSGDISSLPIVVATEDMYDNNEKTIISDLIGLYVGKRPNNNLNLDGEININVENDILNKNKIPQLVNIIEVEPKECRCIHILGSEDMQYEIIPDEQFDELNDSNANIENQNDLNIDDLEVEVI